MTIRGAINRWKRKRGEGTPLYKSTDGDISYTGLDDFDVRLFDHYLTAYFPHRFQYGKRQPDFRVEEINRWLYAHCKGERYTSFDPFFGQGEVAFADEDDAFEFRMSFSDIEKIRYVSSFTMEASYHALAKWGLA